MTKLFFDDLPQINNSILWSKAIGYKCRFNYDGIEGEFIIIDYHDGKIKVAYQSREIWIKTDSVKQGKIQKIVFPPSSEYKYEIGSVLQNDLVITGRYKEKINHPNGKYNIYKHYICHCNRCNHDDIDIPEYYINRKGVSCKYCGTRNYTIAGINDIPTTDPWMIPYFQGGIEEAKQYCRTSNKKINPICPFCGRIRNKKISINTIYYTHSIGCVCSDGISYPNKFMHCLLEQLGLNYESEYSPDWIQPLRYDFYIPNKRLIVEMDGGQHYEDVRYERLMSLENVRHNDEIKDKQAISHNLQIVRIDCNYQNRERFDYVKEQVLNKLSMSFDLENVDWNKIFMESYGNMLVQVCNIKNQNPNLTGIEIAKIVNYDFTSVYKWLNTGEKLGLCKTAKIDQRIIDLNTGKIYKNNISFVREKENEGLNVEKAAVSNMVRRHQDSYKGFRIRKIRDLTGEEREELSNKGFVF